MGGEVCKVGGEVWPYDDDILCSENYNTWVK